MLKTVSWCTELRSLNLYNFCLIQCKISDGKENNFADDNSVEVDKANVIFCKFKLLNFVHPLVEHKSVTQQIRYEKDHVVTNRLILSDVVIEPEQVLIRSIKTKLVRKRNVGHC